MLNALNDVVIIIYVIILTILSFWIKRARTFNDYSVASRKIPGVIIFATLSANFIGPGYTLGLTAKGFEDGYIWFFIFLAFSIQNIIVGIFVAPKISQYKNAYTIGDVMGQHYGLIAKVFTGIISVSFCIGIVAVVSKAGGITLNTLLGIDIWLGAFITTAAVIIYSTVGGIKADIASDTLNFTIFSIIVPLLMVFIIFQIGIPTSSNISFTNLTGSLGNFNFVQLLSLFLGFLLGETLVPPYFNRALAAKNSASARKGFVLAGIFSLFWFFTLTSIGVFGKQLITTANSDSVFWILSQRYLPVFIISLMAVAIAAVIISTQDSFLNSASVAFTNDILKPIKNFSDKKILLLSRITNVIIGSAGVTAVFYIPSLVDTLLLIYTIWAPTIILPLIICIMKKNVHPYSGFFSMLAGGLATGIWEWGLHNPWGVPSILIGLIINQTIFWTIHNMFKSKRNNIIKIFQPT